MYISPYDAFNVTRFCIIVRCSILLLNSIRLSSDSTGPAYEKKLNVSICIGSSFSITIFYLEKQSSNSKVYCSSFHLQSHDKGIILQVRSSIVMSNYFCDKICVPDTAAYCILLYFKETITTITKLATMWL